MKAPALKPGAAAPAGHAASAGHLRGRAEPFGQNIPCRKVKVHRTKVVHCLLALRRSSYEDAEWSLKETMQSF